MTRVTFYGEPIFSMIIYIPPDLDMVDTFDDALVMCQSCRHGGHAAHILEWFFEENGGRAHTTCPVADCECPCADDM